MIRFRIKELIVECNAQRPANERLHMQIVADAINVPRSTLAGLTTYTREPVTNTATVEALCRFFQQRHRDFQMAMLFEFNPPLAQTTAIRVEQLYPQRAAKGRAYRRHEQRRRR